MTRSLKDLVNEIGGDKISALIDIVSCLYQLKITEDGQIEQVLSDNPLIISKLVELAVHKNWLAVVKEHSENNNLVTIPPNTILYEDRNFPLIYSNWDNIRIKDSDQTINVHKTDREYSLIILTDELFTDFIDKYPSLVGYLSKMEPENNDKYTFPADRALLAKWFCSEFELDGIIIEGTDKILTCFKLPSMNISYIFQGQGGYIQENSKKVRDIKRETFYPSYFGAKFEEFANNVLADKPIITGSVTSDESSLSSIAKGIITENPEDIPLLRSVDELFDNIKNAEYAPLKYSFLDPQKRRLERVCSSCKLIRVPEYMAVLTRYFDSYDFFPVSTQFLVHRGDEKLIEFNVLLFQHVSQETRFLNGPIREIREEIIENGREWSRIYGDSQNIVTITNLINTIRDTKMLREIIVEYEKRTGTGSVEKIQNSFKQVKAIDVYNMLEFDENIFSLLNKFVYYSFQSKPKIYEKRADKDNSLVLLDDFSIRERGLLILKFDKTDEAAEITKFLAQIASKRRETETENRASLTIFKPIHTSYIAVQLIKYLVMDIQISYRNDRAYIYLDRARNIEFFLSLLPLYFENGNKLYPYYGQMLIDIITELRECNKIRTKMACDRECEWDSSIIWNRCSYAKLPIIKMLTDLLWTMARETDLARILRFLGFDLKTVEILKSKGRIRPLISSIISAIDNNKTIIELQDIFNRDRVFLEKLELEPDILEKYIEEIDQVESNKRTAIILAFFSLLISVTHVARIFPGPSQQPEFTLTSAFINNSFLSEPVTVSTESFDIKTFREIDGKYEEMLTKLDPNIQKNIVTNFLGIPIKENNNPGLTDEQIRLHNDQVEQGKWLYNAMMAQIQNPTGPIDNKLYEILSSVSQTAPTKTFTARIIDKTFFKTDNGNIVTTKPIELLEQGQKSVTSENIPNIGNILTATINTNIYSEISGHIFNRDENVLFLPPGIILKMDNDGSLSLQESVPLKKLQAMQRLVSLPNSKDNEIVSAITEFTEKNPIYGISKERVVTSSFDKFANLFDSTTEIPARRKTTIDMLELFKNVGSISGITKLNREEINSYHNGVFYIASQDLSINGNEISMSGFAYSNSNMIKRAIERGKMNFHTITIEGDVFPQYSLRLLSGKASYMNRVILPGGVFELVETDNNGKLKLRPKSFGNLKIADKIIAPDDETLTNRDLLLKYIQETRLTERRDIPRDLLENLSYEKFETITTNLIGQRFSLPRESLICTNRGSNCKFTGNRLKMDGVIRENDIMMIVDPSSPIINIVISIHNGIQYIETTVPGHSIHFTPTQAIYNKNGELIEMYVLLSTETNTILRKIVHKTIE